MKKRLILTIFFSVLFCGQVFAGNIIDDGATPTEVTAQAKDDVWLSPSSIPHIMAAPGTIGEFKLDHTVETLNADRTVLISDKTVLWFDCNGSDRNVTLPAMASNSTDLVFTIVNNSDGAGEDLVVKDGNATPVTLFTIGPEQGQRFSCDGTDWEVWFDSGFRYDGVAGTITTSKEIHVADANDTSIIKHVLEPGLGGRLTIGLDETARTMVICDAGDVDTDFGLSVQTHPGLTIMSNAGTSSSLFKHNVWGNTIGVGLQINPGLTLAFSSKYDMAAGNAVTFGSAADKELTDANAEQSWLAVLGKINQTNSAAYNGLKIQMTETSTGNATTGDGGGTNNLILAGTSTDPDKFKVENDGDLTMSVGKLSVAAMTFTFTTEADITDPLTGSMILLDGDNDNEDDSIDLQDGTTTGQTVYLIAAADIDADDTCTINMADTTCTNCPAIVFNKIGENAQLTWTGSTWVVTSVQDAL